MVGGTATEFQTPCSLTPASIPQTSLASIYFLLPSSGETLPNKSLETLKERYFLPRCAPKLIWFLKGHKLLFYSYLRYSIYLPQSGFPLSFHYRIKQGKPLLVSLQLWKVFVECPWVLIYWLWAVLEFDGLPVCIPDIIGLAQGIVTKFKMFLDNWGEEKHIVFLHCSFRRILHFHGNLHFIYNLLT